MEQSLQLHVVRMTGDLDILFAFVVDFSLRRERGLCICLGLTAVHMLCTWSVQVGAYNSLPDRTQTSGLQNLIWLRWAVWGFIHVPRGIPTGGVYLVVLAVEMLRFENLTMYACIYVP